MSEKSTLQKMLVVGVLILAVVGIFALVNGSFRARPFGAAEINSFSSGVTNTSVSILATSTQALAANGARMYALLVNDSANAIYCSMGGTATSNNGFRLNANGGAYEMTLDNLFTGAVNCIASATSTLVVVEK